MATHDRGYKLLFSHPRMVADLLRGFVVGDWVAGIDLDSLERVNASFVSGDLRAREGDLVWRVRWGPRWVYVYLLIEFQSRVEPLMAMRMLGYVALLYQELTRSEEFAPGGALLPPVLPMVLYNGERPWTAAGKVGELIASPPHGLERYAPRLHYLLLDEGRCRLPARDSQHNVVAALFRLERSREPALVLEVLRALERWLGAPEQRSLRRAFAVWTRQVFLPARLPGVEIPDLHELQEVRTMLEQRVKDWTRQWKAEGIAAGRREGLEQGLREGREQGLDQGLEQGLEQGL